MENYFKKILNMRMGMFVHYGIYSAFEGFYQGKAAPHMGEWIQRNMRIPIAEYEKVGREKFCPKPDLAKNLVRKAKAAGMKYIVLTSKHHDGFCLFKTAVSDYSTYSFFGRDICKEVIDACREEGLEVGLYYSHTLDWHEKDAAGNCYWSGIVANNRNSWDYPDDNIDFEKYLQEKCFPQVKEILTNYGPLKLIWFDFPHDITKEQSSRLRDLVKSIQPECQINSRIAHGLCDYYSLADNALPVGPSGLAAECLITLNNTWGYRRDDHNWKSIEDVVGILCRVLNSDATLLVNVGPMADGSLTPETEKLLSELGKWTTRNEEAVYGDIKGNPFMAVFPWGYAATNNKSLYLYVTNPDTEHIVVPGMKDEIASVSLLGVQEDITYELREQVLYITPSDTHMVVPVYKVEFKEVPEFERAITQCGDELRLGMMWAGKVLKADISAKPQKLVCEIDLYREDYGKHGLSVSGNGLALFWNDPEEALCWDAYFTKAGIYEVEVIHALPTAEGKVTLVFDDMEHVVDMTQERGRFQVSKSGEENVRICRDGGCIKVEKAGKYRILLVRDKGGDNLAISEVRCRLKN